MLDISCTRLGVLQISTAHKGMEDVTDADLREFAGSGSPRGLRNNAGSASSLGLRHGIKEAATFGRSGGCDAAI